MTAIQIHASQAHPELASESGPRTVSFQRVLGVWTLLAFLMSLNGVFRETVIVPTAKRNAADILSAAIGIGIILTTTRHFLRRSDASSGLQPRRISSIWLVLTLAFEFAMGRFVDHKSWSELIGNYAIWNGKLWPLVLASMVLSPFVWLARAREPAAEDRGSEPR